MDRLGIIVALATSLLSAIAGLVMAVAALLHEIRARRNSTLPGRSRSSTAPSSDE
jgi:hypothetical protein